MSIRATIKIQCDLCGQVALEQEAEVIPRRAIRAKAAQLGWLYLGDGTRRMIDVCPECAEKKYPGHQPYPKQAI